MKVFFDTNVVLEHLLHRERFYDAEKVLMFLHRSKVPVQMSVGGFYSIVFLVEKYLKKNMDLLAKIK